MELDDAYDPKDGLLQDGKMIKEIQWIKIVLHMIRFFMRIG